MVHANGIFQDSLYRNQPYLMLASMPRSLRRVTRELQTQGPAPDRSRVTAKGLL
jgi:hypothetical protein